MLPGEILAFCAHTETSEKEGIDGKSKEGSFGLFAVLVVGIAHQVERGDSVLQIDVVLVVAVREEQQFEVLNKFYLLALVVYLV